jgi:hypothetical protein
MSSYIGKRPKPSDHQYLKVTPELPYPLPLSLQELCLLEVINDADSYPVELLASLPAGYIAFCSITGYQLLTSVIWTLLLWLEE